MSLETQGKLHKKFDTEQKTDTFQAREFVIETGGEYPQFVKFQLAQDRCQIIDGMNEGDMIKVYFDLRGREWNGKYFTNLNAWKVEKLNSSPAPQPQTEQQKSFDNSDSPNAGMANAAPGADDDLPF